jgi:F0F1-type ATP synthase epsilon subunit
VRVITEYFMRKEQIDVAAAQRDLQAAETKLKELKETIDDVAHQELQREYDWAQARLLLAGGLSN